MDDLNKLCRLWQKRLRLADWKVTVRLVPPGEIPNTLGQIDRVEDEMEALMLLTNDQSPELLEATLVHELLHIRVLPWEGDEIDPALEPKHKERETALNLLAASFIAAYPKRKKRTPKKVKEIPNVNL